MSPQLNLGRRTKTSITFVQLLPKKKALPNREQKFSQKANKPLFNKKSSAPVTATENEKRKFKRSTWGKTVNYRNPSTNMRTTKQRTKNPNIECSKSRAPYLHTTERAKQYTKKSNLITPKPGLRVHITPALGRPTQTGHEQTVVSAMTQRPALPVEPAACLLAQCGLQLRRRRAWEVLLLQQTLKTGLFRKFRLPTWSIKRAWELIILVRLRAWNKLAVAKNGNLRQAVKGPHALQTNTLKNVGHLKNGLHVQMLLLLYGVAVMLLLHLFDLLHDLALTLWK